MLIINTLCYNTHMIKEIIKGFFMQCETISVQACKDLIDAQRDDVMLLDVRSEAECAQRMICTAHNIPLDALVQRIDELPQDKKMIVYCASGNRSKVACEMLQSRGYSDVVNMTGGIRAWCAAGFSTAPQ